MDVGHPGSGEHILTALIGQRLASARPMAMQQGATLPCLFPLTKNSLALRLSLIELAGRVSPWTRWHLSYTRPASTVTKDGAGTPPRARSCVGALPYCGPRLE